MDNAQLAVIDFLSQPWGAIGALCIMLAVTCFNSRRLRARFKAAGFGESATSLLFNALNLAGGACLLVNAVIRQEIVWEVLEVYFVIMAMKGIVQANSRPQAERAVERSA